MDENGFESINIIPLVDVMLVLLTIVLTTSTFIAIGAIPVDLPQTNSTASELVKNHTIEIDKSGVIYLEARQVSLGGLRSSLISLDRSIAILIRADRDIALQRFVDVMDTLKDLGFKKLSLQTESSR